MEECTGKALLEEMLKTITEENSKLGAVTTKVANELVEKLEKALCCVTYPVIEEYFSWWKFKTRIVNKKIVTKQVYYEPNFKKIIVCVVAARPGYGYDYKSIKLEFNIFASIGKDDSITHRIRHDGDVYTPDDVLTKVIKEIAQYTVNFNRKHNVN